MTYRLTRAAETDIIRLYVEGAAEFGLQQADAYHARLEIAFRLIGDNPHIARLREEITPPVRVQPCGSHVIIYVVDARGPLIVRVRHGKEDWASSPY